MKVVGVFKKIIILMFVSMFIASNVAYAEDVNNDNKYFTPTDAKYANWIFLGVVENEIGEVYNYFFQMQRNAQNFHVKVALYNDQTKKLIFKEDSEVTIDEKSNFKWLVGRAFLRYYKTSNSWVFGIKIPNKQGFNFKVSMLNKPEDSPVTRYFQDGIAFIYAQAGRLNGHINLGDETKDQFVTSQNTWFMQTWFKKEPSSPQNLSSLLCRFDDGRGLYSIGSIDSNNLHNSMSGLFDGEGKAMRVSQFINIKKSQEGDWNIYVPTPTMQFKLLDSYQQTDAVAGYVANGSNKGFCLLSSDKIGLQ